MGKGRTGTALGCFSEICRDFKEPQIVGRMLGNTGRGRFQCLFQMLSRKVCLFVFHFVLFSFYSGCGGNVNLLLQRTGVGVSVQH